MIEALELKNATIEAEELSTGIVEALEILNAVVEAEEITI